MKRCDKDVITFLRGFGPQHVQEHYVEITVDPSLHDLRIDSKNIDTENLHVILDEDITLDELDSAMHQLKPCKAVAEDVISNEFLKSTHPVTELPSAISSMSASGLGLTHGIHH